MSVLQSLLQLLLAQLLANVKAERYGAFGFCTMFGVIAAESDELFADWTAAVCFSLA